jgi:hypothetical protein
MIRAVSVEIKATIYVLTRIKTSNKTIEEDYMSEDRYRALREHYQLPIRILYLVENPLTVLKFSQVRIPAVSPSAGDCA